GVEGLRLALRQNEAAERGPRLSPAERAAAAGLVDRLEAALTPLTLLIEAGTLDVPAFARALRSAYAGLTAQAGGEPASPPPGADDIMRWADELCADVAHPGPSFPPRGLDAVLSALMAGYEVRSPARGRDDIAI